MIQSWRYGEHNYARVVGDQIIHDGRSVTPNLYIKRPDDKNWQLASRLRRELLAEQPQAAPARAAPTTNQQHPTSPETPATVEPRCRPLQPGWDLPERRKYRIRLEDFE